MYATEIEAEKAYCKRLEDDAKNERELKYAQICEKFRSHYPYLIEGAEAPKNIRLLLKREFSNAKFLVITRQ